MKYEISRCPYFENGDGCYGELEYIDGCATMIGFFDGVDPNTVAEAFKCKKCNREFVRKWQWELQEINDELPT